MTDRASEPEPADSYSTPGEPVSTDFDTHSPPDRSAYEPPTPATFEATTTPEPPEIAVAGDARRRPVAADAARGHRPSRSLRRRPSPASEAPRSTYTPPPRPEPEPSGGALAIIKSRPGGIAVGVVVAAVLLMIIRRLR